MKCIQTYKELSRFGEYFQSFSLLLARLVLAYGFYKPAMMKWSDIDVTAQWFGNMGIPFATFNAYLVATTEISGVIFLALGLFTRLVSIPLMIVMAVAIMVVHLPNGFSAAANGFEKPLYYMIFLFIFFSFGAGKFSLDHLLFDKK